MGIMHNRNLLKSAFLSSLFLGMFLTATAQTVTEEEVTVIAPYSPRIAKARKIISFPESEINTVTKFKLEYYTNPKLISTTFELEDLKAARYLSPKEQKYKQNIIRGGLGLYTTPFAEVFLSRQWNSKFTFGVHAKHYSSKATVDNYSYSGFSKTGIEIWSKQTETKNVLWFSGFFNRDAFHYYGFQTHNYIWDSEILPDFEKLTAQTFSEAGVNFDFFNISNKTKQNLKVSGTYRYFWDKFDNNENLIYLKGNYQYPIEFLGLKNQYLGIGSDIKLAITNWIEPTQSSPGDPISMVSLLKMRQQFFHGKADLKLSYNIQFDRFNFQAGAIVSAGLDSTSTLKIYPDFLLTANVVKNTLDVYAQFDGGLISPSYYSLSRENPYVSAFVPLSYSSRNHRIKGGLTTNISGIVDIHLWGSTENLQNDVFFTTDTSKIYNNQFKLIYDSVQLLQFGGDLKLDLGDTDVGFLLVYQKYTTTSEEYAWYKPEWKWEIYGDYWLYDNLKLNMTLKGQSAVWAKDAASLRKIGSWYDLSMGANYHFNRDFSAFISMSNMLNQNYKLWYNYPEKGFGAMIGVNYSF